MDSTTPRPWVEVTDADLTKGATLPPVALRAGTPRGNRGSWGPPGGYEPESRTVWSFPDRGTWATHDGRYRGNWSPYVPRNLILQYTQPGDLVLDPMLGSGTTLIECKLLGRHAIGLDINPGSVALARRRLQFTIPPEDRPQVRSVLSTFVADARDLSPLAPGCIDLIATHPPYAGIIQYSADIAADISRLDFRRFLDAMGTVASECFRVLKPGGHCAILIGDTRRRRHYVPLSLAVLSRFLDAGFALKEDIIKVQHNTASLREKPPWRRDFYLISHEHLYVLRKPADNERPADLRWSTRWW